jgi:arylsulfatase A-like enzyme
MRVAFAVATIAWIASAAVWAVLAFRHDALTAIPGEAFTLAIAMIAAHAAVLAPIALAASVFAREAPVARRVMVAIPGLLLLGWGATLWREPVEMPAELGPPAQGPTVVLITLDTFRADHLGAIGGGGLTPELDAFAATGTLYMQAITTGPLTGPAHASMLTGMDVPTHGLVSNGKSVRADTVVPELARRGWRTGAFLSSRVLDRHTGLHAGFEHYDDVFGWRQRLGWIPGLGDPMQKAGTSRDGAATVDRALTWLKADDNPAFLWVHLYDAHMPYEPPKGWEPDPAALAEARAADKADREAAAAGGRPAASVEAAHVREGKLMYAAEIRYVDHLVGRILRAVPEDAVVIVLADHGESLDEHGYWFNHGALLHEPALHVPMIVRWPGRAPAVTDDLVGVQDVAGMLLDATDGSPDGEVQPRDEILAWTSGQQNRRMAGTKRRAERKPSAAIRIDQEKFVAAEGGPVQWYDLHIDPGELAPMKVPDVYSAMDARLRGLVDEPLPDSDPAERARLEALGYVE